MCLHVRVHLVAARSQCCSALPARPRGAKAGLQATAHHLTLQLCAQQHRRRCGRRARAAGGRGRQRRGRRRGAQRARGGAAGAVAQAPDAGCALPLTPNPFSMIAERARRGAADVVARTYDAGCALPCRQHTPCGQLALKILALCHIPEVCGCCCDAALSGGFRLPQDVSHPSVTVSLLAEE